MINLSISKVNFDELNIKTISKRALLDSLEKFWINNVGEYNTEGENNNGYIEYLENIGIDYYKNFTNIYDLNKELNNEIKILQDSIKNDIYGKFNFQISTLIKNLKEMNDLEYYKLNIDLREINDKNTLKKIQDIFLQVPSPSLVDFKEVGDERLSLIYHKRGAMVFFDNLIIANARADKMSMLENFQVPKDNNFIVARFLSLFSARLKNAEIDESFCYSYFNGKRKIDNIQSLSEIINWAKLNLKEKEEKRELEKSEIEKEEVIREQAKNEIKQENNQSRGSLPSDSFEEMISSPSGGAKIYNIQNMQKEKNNELNNKNINSGNENTSDQINIDKVIQDSFEIYESKEFEKTKIRLQKAKEDAYKAYNDLKNYLESGSTILEAIRNIQQKYRNEDTINFATLLFSKEILNLKNKDNEIDKLKKEVELGLQNENELQDEITKREETISKLRGTLQTKVNEIIALKESFEEELQSYKINEEKLLEIEKVMKEQENTINELDEENQNLTEKNSQLQKDLIKVETRNEFLQEKLTEIQNSDQNNEKLKLEIESLKKQYYESQIELEKEKQKVLIFEKNNEELKKTIDDLYSTLIKKNTENQQNSENQIRSADIFKGLQ